ncbi:hypothetical protein K0M31_002634 [Melipona bicolor]|uniref:Uncharacterized protein n=1 Tax=Melipona bicolor TaxID=60889 RepID=A0AA40KZ13_9HYME|nr:hypothetical protein K0M31_002634 [Melipona bicolor]
MFALLIRKGVKHGTFANFAWCPSTKGNVFKDITPSSNTRILGEDDKVDKAQVGILCERYNKYKKYKYRTEMASG